MASILKIGSSWRAQIRRKGHEPITETFPTKAAAERWARGKEADMDASRHTDSRALEKVFVGPLIERYKEDAGPFGKNKEAVLAALKKQYGEKTAAEITDDLMTKHVRDRRKSGVSGVTIGIELTYFSGLFKTARELWKIPVSTEPFKIARANMKHLNIPTKSRERNRRPTEKEIERLCKHFDQHSALPMRDIIWFAIDSAMRLSEIVGILWADLNKKDKTVIIRNRKHPKEKIGNDQEVPLLGKAFEIVLRQPKDDDRIFPCSADTISSIFPRACQQLEIVDLHFHDFRHEGVSRLFEKGYGIQEVALISGHRDWNMLARYTQLKAKDLHR